MSTAEHVETGFPWQLGVVPPRVLFGQVTSGCLAAVALVMAVTTAVSEVEGQSPERRTTVAIEGEKFLINGKPTYPGREWNGHPIEGLLMNSRMVQGIFDDLNPETVERWVYPDTGRWDADRNTQEFIAAMPSWLEHGVIAFTINLQGGSPEGYSRTQPWHNSAFTDDGQLRSDYMERLDRILTRADELGMVPILGLFYFGQDERMNDEAAVVRAVDNAIDWVVDRGYRNVLIEVNNECNVRYDHEILQPPRVHELIERVQSRSAARGYRLLTSTSYGGGKVPMENVVKSADFLLLHGNGVSEPERMVQMVDETRKLAGENPKPIVNNEDDHYDFDQPMNNMVAAVSRFASWGFFDFRRRDEGFDEGYQSVPVNWAISSPRKKAFFDAVREITGGCEVPQP